jgi:hypothetical protein
MNISSTGSGANINVGVVSRPVFGQDDSDHDNGRRAHGKPDSFRSDFRSLLQAVQSGDMTSAQSALASIKSDVASATYSPASVPPAAASAAQSVDPTAVDPASADASATAAATSATPASTVSSDLKALFDAVGSGDASSAQTALANFVSDRQAAWQQRQGDASSSQGQQQAPRAHGHHGHRHHGLESVIASLFSGAPSTTTAPSSTDASADTTTDVSDSSATPATTAA